MEQDVVEVHKLAKKERHQYPAILAELTWSIKDVLYDFWVVLSRQDSSISPARVANHSPGSDLSCPLTELAI